MIVRTFPGARHPVDVGFATTGTEWRSGAALTDREAAERSIHGNSRNGDVSEYQFVLRNVHKWWV